MLLSIPVGRPRTEFNAQRVHRPATVPDLFPDMRLASFAVVDDDGVLHDPAAVDAWGHLKYGCGLYEFVRV